MRYPSVCVLLVSFWLAGCAGKVAVVKKPGTSFARSSTITVVAAGNDFLGVQGQLEHLLLSRGFEVVSEAVARERVKYEDSIQSGAGESSASASLERVTEVPSAYIMRYSYSTRPDFPNRHVFTQFSASVVDLRDGALQASVDFSQGELGSKSVQAVLREVAESLAR